MRLLDALFTRRRRRPDFAGLSESVRRRLGGACRELTEAEDHLAAQLGLASPPRLLLVDEETGVVLAADDRRAIAVGAASL
jgi:hypothetical protein